MPKKRKASNVFNLFGNEFDYKDYIKRLMPEGKNSAEKLYKKIGINRILKPTSKLKTKYWDCNKKYPTTINDFIKHFFKKRKPKNLEGIWQQNVNGQLVTFGLVNQSGAYHGYIIDNQMKLAQTSGSFFKDIFNPPEADYSITNGTKFGIYYYDKKRKSSVKNEKLMKFKGIATIIDTYSFDEHFPINIENDRDVIQIGDRHLMGDSDEEKLMEEKMGLSRSSIKIWPEIKVKEVPKDHPGFRKYGERQKEIEEEKKSGGAVGSGFFVSDKGHIVTNYHVIKDCKKQIKFLYNDEEIDAKLIASDQRLDLALLKAKIENKTFIKFTNKSPQKAQNILVAGFPYGKALSDDLKVTAGIINSLKGIGNNTSMLQVDATINPGNSGGPIVDKITGNLVAVATMKLNKDFTKQAFGVESENTNYGIKSSQVKDFLEANNLKVKVKKNKFKISELENSTVFIYCK